jgi:CRISPR/Cas system-associated protein Csm6
MPETGGLALEASLLALAALIVGVERIVYVRRVVSGP